MYVIKKYPELIDFLAFFNFTIQSRCMLNHVPKVRVLKEKNKNNNEDLTHVASGPDTDICISKHGAIQKLYETRSHD